MGVHNTELSNSKITTLTYGLYVSKGIAALIGRYDALGETFHITANKQYVITWKEILDVYLAILEKHLGYKPKVLLQNLADFLTMAIQVLDILCFMFDFMVEYSITLRSNNL
ncbi:hypothetical protein AGMMS49574_19280 [Bacteroidia bacterium]|nr:hypothetical protein AGMMS49574_19280 [Bacteroidia bacterium]